jgi:hypothetical protein
MNRWFNTAGPCQPEMHYTLPSLPRLPQIELLIDRAGYFVLSFWRQHGEPLLNSAAYISRHFQLQLELVNTSIDSIMAIPIIKVAANKSKVFGDTSLEIQRPNSTPTKLVAISAVPAPNRTLRGDRD